jgi:hypothetical protein
VTQYLSTIAYDVIGRYSNHMMNRTQTENKMSNNEAVSDSQGVCKDCGNGTLNNELNPAFEFVYNERNDTDVLVCLACGSSHLDVL